MAWHQPAPLPRLENIDNYKNVFEKKRVGLITNPTGITSDFESSIDVLRRKTNLVGLFSPEHGVRASIQAGVHLDTYIDDETGITVYSLYGKNKKPSKEVMDNVDVLTIDIQDNGSRYYTFIYSPLIELATKLLVKRTPSLPMRSMFGVWM